jgi:hypothetical protein
MIFSKAAQDSLILPPLLFYDWRYCPDDRWRTGVPRRRRFMHSDLIGKIEKARYYAQEPERFAVDTLMARFQGGNNEHSITLDERGWVCDCGAFQRHQTCAHVMALQKILAPMLAETARADVPLAMHSEMISMIEKSRHYTHEPQRVTITSLVGRFHGSNNDHGLGYAEHTWACDCTTFRLYQTCAHVMALQKILVVMLPPEALQALGPIGEQQIASVLN